MLPEPIVDLLRVQFGLIGRHQVRQVEPSRNARRTVYAHPDLEPVTSRVLRHRIAPPCSDQAVMATVLDSGPGALLWSKSAATHWGFGRYRLLPAHVAVRRVRRGGDRLGQAHVITSLEDCDRVVHHDIPVARPEVTVLWLAGMLTHRFGHEVAFERTAVVLDHAWRQRLIDGDYIHQLAARSGGRGRSGIVVLRQALETRPPGYQPAGSRLEERFEDLLPHRLQTLLERQVTVDTNPVIRTVDYRVKGRPMIIEINGEAFHTSLTDRGADQARYERLLALGFSVIVFWEYDIWHDAPTVRQATASILDRNDRAPTLHRPTRSPWEW